MYDMKQPTVLDNDKNINNTIIVHEKKRSK